MTVLKMQTGSNAAFKLFAGIAALAGIATLGACATGYGTNTQPAAQETSERTKPNVIYILADDLGYADISPFGQKLVDTPNLTRLAESGMIFTQHYSGATVCAPSRSTLLTGQHTGNTQVRHNGGGRDPGTFLTTERQTLVSLMNDAGYITGAVGKWGMGYYGQSGSPEAQGFDYFYGYVGHIDAHNHYPPFLVENGMEQKLDNNVVVHDYPEPDGQPDRAYDRQFIGNDYAPELIAEKASAFIERNADQPFFLYYASAIPHAALQAPEDEMDQFSFPETPSEGDYYQPHSRPRAARAAMIKQLDREVGQLLDMLDAKGLTDNTLIIFTSDNGPAPEGSADIEFFESSAPFRGHKRDLTEGGIRAPMIASWPGTIAAGSSSEHVTAMWDVMATMSDLTGVPITDQTDGISILPTLLGDEAQEKHDYLYWEFHGSGKKPHAQAVRIGDFKAIRVYAGKRSGPKTPLPMQVYDLSSDIKEQNDIAAQHPDIVRQADAIMAARTPSINPAWNFSGE